MPSTVLHSKNTLNAAHNCLAYGSLNQSPTEARALLHAHAFSALSTRNHPKNSPQKSIDAEQAPPISPPPSQRNSSAIVRGRLHCWAFAETYGGRPDTSGGERRGWVVEDVSGAPCTVTHGQIHTPPSQDVCNFAGRLLLNSAVRLRVIPCGFRDMSAII